MYQYNISENASLGDLQTLAGDILTKILGEHFTAKEQKILKKVSYAFYEALQRLDTPKKMFTYDLETLFQHDPNYSEEKIIKLATEVFPDFFSNQDNKAWFQTLLENQINEYSTSILNDISATDWGKDFITDVKKQKLQKNTSKEEQETDIKPLVRDLVSRGGGLGRIELYKNYSNQHTELVENKIFSARGSLGFFITTTVTGFAGVLLSGINMLNRFVAKPQNTSSANLIMIIVGAALLLVCILTGIIGCCSTRQYMGLGKNIKNEESRNLLGETLPEGYADFDFFKRNDEAADIEEELPETTIVEIEEDSEKSFSPTS